MARSDERSGRRRRQGVEREQREARGSQPSPAVRTLIFLMVLEITLMGFCLILAILDERELAIAAGTAAVGLAVEIGRRVVITGTVGGQDPPYPPASLPPPPERRADEVEPAGSPLRLEMPKKDPDGRARAGYFD
jgi:hypothetical protein